MTIFSPQQTAPHVEQAAEQAALEQAFAAPEEKRSDPARIPRWVALLAANLADAGTTHAAMNRGAVEGNPLMRGIAGNPAALYGVKGGIGVAQALLMDLLAKKHPKVANGVGFGMAGATGALAARNATRAR